MIVYLDSTYVIRRLLGIRPEDGIWGKWEKAYASALLRTECCRVANKLRLDGRLDDAGRARLGAWIETVCDSVVQIPVTDAIVRRAADAFPVSIGTLQAVHLASMLELEEVYGVKCALATDDEGLLCAAKALGFSAAEAVTAGADKPADPPAKATA